MATTIKTKNSTTAATAPTGLVQGELAVNITDKKLYVGDNAGNSIQIAGQGATNGAGGSNTQVQYNSSGALAGSANLTFNGSDLTVYGITVGRGAGAVSTNTAVGASALAANTTGTANTAVGQTALQANTSGVNSNAFGRSALYSNTTGNYNNSFGTNALFANTTGSYNTAVGDSALVSNTTASYGTAVGFQSARYQTGGANTFIGTYSGVGVNGSSTGTANAALGYSSLAGLTTGNSNTAIGYEALTTNTTASNNTAVGYQAMYSNTTATTSTAMGYQAGYTNATGGTYGGYNTYFGAYAGNLDIGGRNTYIGGGAGNAMTTGNSNTILGRYSGNQGGLDIRTASNYIVLSDGDGNPRQVIDSSGDVLFGTTAVPNGTSVYGAGFQASGQGRMILLSASNSTASANLALFLNPNGLVGAIYTSGSSTTYGTSSDYRLKDITGDLTGYKQRIMALKPKQGTWKVDGSVFKGFVAHEFAEQYPSAVSGQKDGMDDEGKPVYQAMQAGGSETIADLVAYIQELETRLTALENK